jgi:DNA-binding MarR family transcriptional regulator
MVATSMFARIEAMQRSAGRGALKGENDTQPAQQIRLGELEHRIGFHLRLAQDASFRAFKRDAGEQDLRPGWFAVLSLIRDNPGITPMALSRASGRDKSTITPILQDLARLRLIDSTPVASDKRSYTLSLTRAGIERLSHLDACAAEHDRKLDEIAGDRKEELITLLRQIVAALE